MGKTLEKKQNPQNKVMLLGVKHDQIPVLNLTRTLTHTLKEPVSRV